MNAIKATVKGGRLDLQVPPDWPDGTEVEIHPVVQAGANGEDGPMTPDEIARTLAAMDKVVPFVLTDEERAAIAADRQARKEWEKARFNQHANIGVWDVPHRRQPPNTASGAKP